MQIFMTFLLFEVLVIKIYNNILEVNVQFSIFKQYLIYKCILHVYY